MASWLAPSFSSPVFNSSAFESGDGITKSEADRLYLSILAGKNLGLIDNIINGTAQPNKALILDGASSITGINNLSFSGALAGPIINANSYLLAGSSILASALTSITPGTASASKALVLDISSNIANIGSISQTIAAGSDFITLTSTSTTTRNTIRFVTDSNSLEFGSRSSASGSYPNSFYMYSGGSYKWTMNASTGDTLILSTSDATTIANGALRISGGLSVAKKIFTNDTLTIDRNGSNLSLINGANSGLIEVAASPNILRLVNGYALNISSTGLTVASSSIQAARYALDMQATAADIKLCLFQSGSNGTYGVGANNSRLIMCSGGQGHGFYKSSSGGSLGTLQAEIDTNSNFIASNNLISGVGVFIREGFSSAGLSGNGLKLHCATSQTSEIFAYNYTTGTFKDIKLSNSILCNGGSGFAGIGLGAGSIIAYPWVVNDTISSSVPGSYGYLSISGSGTGSDTGSVQVSIYASGRVFATEFDAYSDRRLKHKIEPIDSNLADRFIDEVEPVQFEWRNEDAGKRQGYIAQQLLSTGLFQDLVTFHVDDKMTADHESPRGYSLAVQYNNVSAILHQAIKNIKDKVKIQETRIKKNESEINDLKYMIEELSKKMHIYSGDYMLL